MPKPDPKVAALRDSGTLHPRPHDVADELFSGIEFFDPRDLLQVKYEMLRRVRIDRLGVSSVARDFGCTRPTYYQAAKQFDEEGVMGLIPKKRGPKSAHKLNDEVIQFVELVLAEEPTLKSASLAARIRKHFHFKIHPRSVERALARHRNGGGKKGLL